MSLTNPIIIAGKALVQHLRLSQLKRKEQSSFDVDYTRYDRSKTFKDANRALIKQIESRFDDSYFAELEEEEFVTDVVDFPKYLESEKNGQDINQPNQQQPQFSNVNQKIVNDKVQAAFFYIEKPPLYQRGVTQAVIEDEQLQNQFPNYPEQDVMNTGTLNRQHSEITDGKQFLSAQQSTLMNNGSTQDLATLIVNQQQLSLNQSDSDVASEDESYEEAKDHYFLENVQQLDFSKSFGDVINSQRVIFSMKAVSLAIIASIRLRKMQKIKKPLLDVLVAFKQIDRVEPEKVVEAFELWFLKATKLYRYYLQKVGYASLNLRLDEINLRSERGDTISMHLRNSITLLLDGLDLMAKCINPEILNMIYLQEYDDEEADHCPFVSRRVMFKQIQTNEQMDPLQRVLVVAEYLILFNLLQFLMTIDVNGKLYVILITSIIQILFFGYTSILLKTNPISPLIKHRILQIEVFQDHEGQIQTLRHEVDRSKLRQTEIKEKINKNRIQRVNKSEVLYYNLYDHQELEFLLTGNEIWFEKTLRKFDIIMRKIVMQLD